ncbi:mechanosensitive ion channel family protein [Paraburkholderia diazotrophica]|uniref:Mechanosensitive ion channel n=1 Tax=Paraburkholderia diazotrophica TaxID=667676 RepID=A0A1H7ASL6_9BURK|nr:mechanosensitive ion channel domain-containing protein [Paraburkholderia diazotrophica]SEJ68298.1 Mechanosensitive ion channel [Paraburkholderia diazotrophica]
MLSFDDIERIVDAPMHSWPGGAVVSIIAMAIALAVQRIGARIVTRIARPYPLATIVLAHIDVPTRVLLMMLGLLSVFWVAPDTLRYIVPLRDVAAFVLIATVTWLAMRLAASIGEAIIQAHPLDTADNLQARRIHTQARVLARSVMVVIVIVGVGGALMMFPAVRQIGASLLASAGVAGLVAGIAARPVLGNLIAGLQIALSQPIRLDDVVVIENEWGRIEEITGTYVSVRLWDMRRLVVPLQWFIEHPFTNWTRSSAQIIGTVFLYVDYHMPLAPLREELGRLLKEAPEWDGSVQVLQATDATERALQLRVLVSSMDSGLNWDLRCRVREGLLCFIQNRYPQYLPHARAEVTAELERSSEFPPAPQPPAHDEPVASSTAADTPADPVAATGGARVRRNSHGNGQRHVERRVPPSTDGVHRGRARASPAH